ncbi:MAG: homoserine kinase [Desulfotignum sp.]|nr:homoserine kinase [Desulfotignum sp.]MCF8088164.1 homoserine kinase [Desulfotignum sp.]MCF8139136.1 homoserine kinase [Desulfotignum sp.]
MAEYTRLTPETIASLLSCYDLGTVTDMTPLAGGLANSSIKITTVSGTYTLTVCDEKNAREIDCLTRVVAYLDKQGIPTPRVIPARSGDLFIMHDSRPVYIKEFLPGQVREDLSFSMLSQVGEVLADLHRLDPPPEIPQQFPYGMGAFSEIFEMRLDHPYVDWLRQKIGFLQSALDPAMEKGLIHGDLFWDNLVFTHDILVAVLDFEEACHYYKLYDIGMCAIGCCARDERLSMARIASLVQGYEQRCPLTHTEKKQLKIFIEYAGVAASFWRFRQYHVRHPDPTRQNSHLELSSRADQVHAMDDREFLDRVFTSD